jgi:hypothetical protein
MRDLKRLRWMAGFSGLAISCLWACGCADAPESTDSNAGVERTTSALTVATPPSGTLGSGTNYILANSDCKVLKDVEVTIDITQDLVAPNGWGFQLNANSAKPANGDPTIIWQQYIMGVFDEKTGGPTGVNGGINNWNTADLKKNVKPTIGPPTAYLPQTLPTENTVPAGYKLIISLQNDSAGDITGMTLEVDHGTVKGTPFPMTLKAAGATAKQMVPIVSFELDVVGPGGGSNINFSSGAGTITYKSSTPLTAMSHIPACAGSTATTAETSNALYGPMPTGSSTTFNQSLLIPKPICFAGCGNGECCGGEDTCLSVPKTLTNPSTVCCAGNACNEACCPPGTPCTDVATSKCGTACKAGDSPAPAQAIGSGSIDQTCQPTPTPRPM